MKKLLSLFLIFTLNLANAASVLTVPQGGTGATTLTGIIKGAGTAAMTAVTAPTGAIVGTTDTQTLTNKTLTNPTDTSQTLSYASPIVWNAASGAIATVTLTGSGSTIDMPTNAVVGTYVLHIIQDTTGSRTVSWQSGYEWSGGTAPTLTATASHQDICTFVYDGTYMFGSCVLNFPVN